MTYRQAYRETIYSRIYIPYPYVFCANKFIQIHTKPSFYLGISERSSQKYVYGAIEEIRGNNNDIFGSIVRAMHAQTKKKSFKIASTYSQTHKNIQYNGLDGIYTDRF